MEVIGNALINTLNSLVYRTEVDGIYRMELVVGFVTYALIFGTSYRRNCTSYLG